MESDSSLHQKTKSDEITMKNLQTLLLLAPFGLLAQNQSNNTFNGNFVFNNTNGMFNISNNLNVSNNINTQINILSNQAVYATNVGRNYSNNKATATRVNTAITTNKVPQRAVYKKPTNQVAVHKKQNTSPAVAKAPVQAQTISNPVNEQVQINISPKLINDNNDNNNINSNPVEIQQAVVQAPQQQVAQTSKVSSSEKESSISLPKINLPKMNFGGKGKSSGASHHVKKHAFKKFWVRFTRKAAAKSGGKKKHFILDKCAEWFK